MRTAICWIAMGCVLAISPAVAQDKKDAEKASAEKAAAEKPIAEKPAAAKKDVPLSEEAAAFRKMHTELKALVERLRNIQKEYKEVKPEGRKVLEDEFESKKAEAERILPTLRTAAEKAIISDPTNEDLIDFLGAYAFEADERGDPVEALRLSHEVVLNNELNARKGASPPHDRPHRPDLHRIAATAAFYLSKWDLADRHFKELEKYEDYSGGNVQQIRKALPEERQYWEAETKLRQEEAKSEKDPKTLLPRVRLQTTQGEIVVELFENDAPNTVANFISLVESKFYDNKPFFRVSAERAATGRVAATENELDYTIEFEATNKNFRRHFYGSLFMIRPYGKDSASSEFGIALRRFFPFGDPQFDEKGEHKSGSTVFGRVVDDDLHVLHKLRRVDAQGDTSAEPDRILSATVDRKRGHEYKPKKQLIEKAKTSDDKTRAKEPIKDATTDKESKKEPAKEPDDVPKKKKV